MSSGLKTHAELRGADASRLRAVIREGAYDRHTAGLAEGQLQCNIVVLPEEFSLDFMRYCQRNPKPCPLVGVSETGDPVMRTLGDIDIRSDVPLYNIYRDGTLSEQRKNIHDIWQDDFVAFALGCSFTFERALSAAGISLRHVEQDRTVSMYRTNIETVQAGPFQGGMVVSMRPIVQRDLARTIEICNRFPLAHGGPVHVGDPSQIGIANISAPDWGDPVEIKAGEIPVFWACGVTPQNAIMQARPPLCITHAPGAMLITDVSDDAEIPVLIS